MLICENKKLKTKIENLERKLTEELKGKLGEVNLKSQVAMVIIP